MEATPDSLKAAFVYSGGRADRWKNARSGDAASDFFYGAVEWEHAGHSVCVKDLESRDSKVFIWFLDVLMKGKLPPKTGAREILAARRLLKNLRNVEGIVATSSGSAFGLAFWKRLGKLPPPVLGIHCGIVNCSHAPGPRKAARKFLGSMQPVLFADAEAQEMHRQFEVPPPPSAWFGVDETFWNPPEKAGIRNGVLAVGNDARRDYETLLAAARLVPDISFRVITCRQQPDHLPSNVIWAQGDWKGEGVSDLELRELYRNAACVVVPLIESIQPSGQSVAMQAMMCGAPVIHSKTAGWWGKDVIHAEDHVKLVPPGDSAMLAEAIKNRLAKGSTTTARNALLAEKWTTSGFATRLEHFLFRQSSACN